MSRPGATLPDPLLSPLEAVAAAAAELARWQPHLPVALEHLHPQHRQAVQETRDALAALDRARQEQQ